MLTKTFQYKHKEEWSKSTRKTRLMRDITQSIRVTVGSRRQLSAEDPLVECSAKDERGQTH